MAVDDSRPLKTRKKHGGKGTQSTGETGWGGKRSETREASPEITIGLREAAIVLILLGSLTCVAFGNVVFFGKSLVATDNRNPFDERFSVDTYGEGYVPAAVWTDRGLIQDPNFHDAGATWWQWEPGAIFFRTGLLEHGELPFWDPYVAAGTPAMANLTATAFFPPYFAVVLLGATPFLKNAYFLSLLVAAGFFTHVVLRKHGLPRDAALLGGTLFLFSGALVQNVNSFLGQTVACLPFTLFLTRRFFDRPTWRRSAALTIGYSAVALSSFPPILAAIFGFNAFYSMVVMGAEVRVDGVRRGVILTRWAAAVAAAIGLVAFYYVPAFLLMAASPQVRVAYTAAGLLALPLLTLFQLLSPELVGGKPINLLPAFPSPFYITLWYSGAVALLLAGFAGRGPDRRRNILFWSAAGAAVLVVLKVVGVPPVQWIGYLPVLRTLHFGVYFPLLLNFLLAVLAAIGFAQVAEGHARTGRFIGVLVLACLTAGVLRQMAVRRGVFAQPEAAHWLGQYISVAVLALVVGVIVVGFRLVRRRTWTRTVLAVSILALAAIEGISYAAYPRQKAWDVWRHPVPYVQTLKDGPRFGRVLALGAPEANTNSAFEVFGLDSLMAFNPPRVFQFYKAHLSPATEFFLRGGSRVPSEGVLDAANIERIVVRLANRELAGSLAERGYPIVFDDGYVRIHARAGRPRYFFTSRYRLVPEENALTELGISAASGPLLLERAPSFRAASDDGGEPSVVVKEFRRNGYRLALRAPRAGLVYMSESYFDGWKARVNGRPAQILPANYAFRAVEVPPGEVEIEMSYRPPGFNVGLAVSLAAAVALAVFARQKD